jgi:hypothetical protein
MYIVQTLSAARNERQNAEIVTLVSSGYHFLGALALKD